MSAHVTKARLVQLDVMRAFAIFLVVLIHFERYVLYRWPVLESFVFSLGEIGVPLFVMLTGYLMLGRTYEGDYLRRFLTRNLMPLLVAFMGWSFIWYLLGHAIPEYSGKAGVQPFAAVLRSSLLVGMPGNGLWFLPMMFGLYLGLPIVSHTYAFLSESRNAHYRRIVLAALVLFATVVPTIEEVASPLGHPLGLAPVLEMNIFGAGVWGGSIWIGYLVLGGVLARADLGRIRTGYAVLLAAFGFAIQWGTKLLGLAADTGTHLSYANLGLVLSSFATFVLFVKNGKVTHGAALFSWMSRAAFGLYVIHPWIGEIVWVEAGRITDVASLTLPGALAGLGFLLAATMILSYVAVALLGRIPGLGRWLLLMK